MAEEKNVSKTDKVVRKNEKIGEVVSAKMAKTIVVQVTRRVPHRRMSGTWSGLWKAAR